MKQRRWTAIGSCGLLLATMAGVARTAAQEAPRPLTADQDSTAAVRVAPPPLDLFEPVTSQPVTEQTPESREAVIALLKRAFQQRPFGRRYSVRVAFTAAGAVQEVGPGEMDETATAVNHRRWTGRVGSFSMTRVIADRGYDSVPPGPIPIRLHMVRADVLGPSPPSTWGTIRTAKAVLNATLVTCILTSVHGSDAPVRDWPEIEYCVDPQTQLLRVFSSAPGIYIFYDYAASPESPIGRPPVNHPVINHPVLSQMTVMEAGQLVLQASISFKLPGREELAPSLFTPTSGMYTDGVGLIGPTYQTQFRGRTAASGELQPVVIHATLAPDGSVVEAESLQTSDQALSQSALDLVKKTKYATTFNYGYAPQQEIFVTVE